MSGVLLLVLDIPIAQDMPTGEVVVVRFIQLRHTDLGQVNLCSSITNDVTDLASSSPPSEQLMA
jgi:hypothetical protein